MGGVYVKEKTKPKKPQNTHTPLKTTTKKNPTKKKGQTPQQKYPNKQNPQPKKPKNPTKKCGGKLGYLFVSGISIMLTTHSFFIITEQKFTHAFG